jgi:hypothetical protein
VSSGNLTLPIGVQAELAAEKSAAQLRILEAANSNASPWLAST